MTVEITTLPNGLRVATDTMHEAESAVIGAWVGVGTRHEPAAANGVAHLVEHMMFKGTKNRSAFALSKDIEENGGQMNAHTTREETAYYARVLPEDAGLACEIIGDMLQHSLFDPKELDRERTVIIQEIGRDRDTPEDHVFDLMHQRAFAHQRLGRPVLGSPKVIAGLPRSAVRGYVKRYYHAGNIVIVGAGRIAHKDLVAMAKKNFGRLPRGRTALSQKAHMKGGEVLLAKDSEQLHLILAFPAPGALSPASYAAMILSILLGGSASSRLFQKVREKRGLVYTVHAGHIPFADTGLFEIYAGTDPARVKELLPVICDELNDVKRHITPAELARAKAQARADLLMGQETVMRRADALGHQLLTYGEPIAVEQILRRVMSVTRNDVQAMARRMFTPRMVVAAMGPVGLLSLNRKIIKMLK